MSSDEEDPSVNDDVEMEKESDGDSDTDFIGLGTDDEDDFETQLKKIRKLAHPLREFGDIYQVDTEGTMTR